MMAYSDLLDRCHDGGCFCRLDLQCRLTRESGVFLRIHCFENRCANQYGEDQHHTVHTNTEQERLQRADNELAVGWFHGRFGFYMDTLDYNTKV